jgi:hypothetical protein
MSRDRPDECEIEITPEMIDRAVERLIWHDVSDGNPLGIIHSVLEAMGAVESCQRLVFRKGKGTD